MASKHVFPEFLFHQKKKKEEEEEEEEERKRTPQNYLLPGDLSKQRLSFTHTPNPEIMIHTEIKKGRTHTAPSEENAAILT